MAIRIQFLATFTALLTGELLAAEPENLEKLRFTAVYHVPGEHSFDFTTSIGEFTVKGPNRETLKPLPSRTVKVTQDPKSKVYYTLTHHDVFRLDSELKNPTEVTPTFENEEHRLSWPCGITFDSKRKRLLVISFGGKGYLYSYSPGEDKWDVITDANNVTYAAIGYSESDDRIYALYQGYHDESGPNLCQFNSAGAVVSSVPLKHSELAKAIGGVTLSSITQLIPLEKHIVVLVTPQRISDKDGARRTRMFVIHKSDHSIVETWSE